MKVLSEANFSAKDVENFASTAAEHFALSRFIVQLMKGAHSPIPLLDETSPR